MDISTKQRFSLIESAFEVQVPAITSSSAQKSLWNLALLVAMIGVGLLSFLHDDVAAKARVAKTQLVLGGSAVTNVPYFPSQYMNQAREIEPVPPTF